MEILVRKNHGNNGLVGEVVPLTHNSKDIREEAIRRGAKAGHCTSNGEPPYRTKIMAAAPNDAYRRNYQKIFNHE
jgi:hypothetical protein